jgi:hypothetical protein
MLGNEALALTFPYLEAFLLALCWLVLGICAVAALLIGIYFRTLAGAMAIPTRTGIHAGHQATLLSSLIEDLYRCRATASSPVTIISSMIFDRN